MLETTVPGHREASDFPEGIIMQHVANEDLMFRRHIRLQKANEITCEFTQDPGLLHQYFVLRSIYLSKFLPTPVSPEPDAYDMRSDIMVVKVGRQVVGGIRVIIRHNQQEPALYIERGGFNLAEQVSELNLHETPYCEFSKLFVLEEFQNSEVIVAMYRALLDFTSKNGIHYAFATSAPETARVHRLAARRHGVNFTLLSHIRVPTEGPERADNRTFQQLMLIDDLPVSHTPRLFLNETIQAHGAVKPESQPSPAMEQA